MQVALIVHFIAESQSISQGNNSNLLVVSVDDMFKDKIKIVLIKNEQSR